MIKMAKSVRYKEYQKEYQKQYREQNKERLGEYFKQYRRKNAEKIREYKKLYRGRNKEKIREYQKQYREKHKTESAENGRLNYYWYKSHGICPHCRTNYIRKGRSSCADCAEYFALNHKKKPPLTDTQKEQSRKRNKRYRDLLVAFGVCQDCGKRDASPNHTLCVDCLIKKRRRGIEHNRKKGCIPADLRYNSGFCYFCCKKIDDGQLLCEKCKTEAAKRAEYARSFVDREKLKEQLGFTFSFKRR